MDSVVADLLDLSHKLGDSAHGMTILAEGNASAATDHGTFWIKASGRSLGSLTEDHVVEVHTQAVLDSLEEDLDDAAVRARLLAVKVNSDDPQAPSVETFMHAYLLTLPDVGWIAHTHPITLLGLLCLADAEERAAQRFFPDEIVCCGPATCYVPYVDPGLPLARAIRDAVARFVETHGEAPKTIWLQNHGLIVLGKSPQDAWSGTYMAEKAARVWQVALSSGRPLTPLTPAQVERIHRRPDEHYRQRLLWQVRRATL